LTKTLIFKVFIYFTRDKGNYFSFKN